MRFGVGTDREPWEPPNPPPMREKSQGMCKNRGKYMAVRTAIYTRPAETRNGQNGEFTRLEAPPENRQAAAKVTKARQVRLAGYRRKFRDDVAPQTSLEYRMARSWLCDRWRANLKRLSCKYWRQEPTL